MSNELMTTGTSFEELQAVINGAIVKQNQKLFMKLQEIGEEQNKQGKNLERFNFKLEEFDNNLPLFGVECDRITSVVRAKGTHCLGGKKSKAYQDNSIRSKIYSDIYSHLKREFGVSSYKAIKRNQVDLAIGVLGTYELSHELKAEINECNQQMEGTVQ